MVEHGVTIPVEHESSPVEATTAMPRESARAWWLPADRWMQVVIGIVVLALVVWAFKGLAVAGLVLLCPLMMIAMMFGMGHGMHRMHGRHLDSDSGDNGGAASGDGAGGDRALDILRERYAQGELTPEQYEEMRRQLS
jgi:uncharacterized membrane protein